jgi:hypothetical protein
MSAFRFRIGLGLIWSAIGVALLLRDWLFPAELFARYDATRLTLGGWLAVVLAVWNGVRAWSGAAVGRKTDPNPLRHDRSRTPTGEYNPAFDFNKPTVQETGGKPNTSSD